ncbi:MAG TPA: hypothetical protein VLG49_00465 [Rhabdochlamydiaceae bacterium]|nr:hypothetical protein [Rhabdochlamydiaceae bacterium]
MSVEAIFPSSTPKHPDHFQGVYEASSEHEIGNVQKVFQETVKRKTCDNPSDLSSKCAKPDLPESPVDESPDTLLVMRGEKLYVHSKSLITDEDVYAPFEQEAPTIQPYIAATDQLLSGVCFYVERSYSEKLNVTLKIIRRMLKAIEKNNGASLSISELNSFLPNKLKKKIEEGNHPQYTIDLPFGTDHPNYAFKDIYVLGLILKALFISTAENQDIDNRLVKLIPGITDKFTEIDFIGSSLIGYLHATEKILINIEESNRAVRDNLTSVTSCSQTIPQKKQPSPDRPMHEMFSWEADKVYVLTDVCKFIPIENRLLIIDGIASRIFDIETALSEEEMQFYSPKNIGVFSSSIDKQLHVSSINLIESFAASVHSEPELQLLDPTAMKMQKFRFIETFIAELFSESDPKDSEIDRKITNLRKNLIDPKNSLTLTLNMVRHEIKRLRSSSKIQN